MALPQPVRFKADDLWKTPDDSRRYEVIEGRMYVTPVPWVEHQGVSGRLSMYIWGYARQRGVGKLYAPLAVVLDEENGVQPDLVYVSRDRYHLLSERGVEGAPDLLVEIISPCTRRRDCGVKMRVYAAAGVPHYWIVDPRTRALEAYRLGELGYELTGKYGLGEVFRPELFPGLEIPIDDLWA